MTDLSQLRQEIDKIDDKLRPLLRERAEKSSKIGKIKAKTKTPTQDRSREKEILAKCETPYEKAVFKKILEESRKLQP